MQLVGDDLFVTNTERIKDGIAKSAANSVLVKVNQIGTLTETLESVEMAHRTAGRRSSRTARARPRTRSSPTWRWPMRSGQIKTGSLARSERVAKYNRLLRIEQELGATAIWGGSLGRL